jgi:Homeodomain-like domain
MADVGRALDEVRSTNDELHTAIQQKETAKDRRDRAIRRAHEAGASLQVIAEVLGVHRSYVHQIVRAE